MSKALFGGTTQQIIMGLVAALMFIMAVEASQLGFGGGFSPIGFFGWDDSGELGWHAASFSENDGTTKVRVHQKGCRIQLEQQGEVSFSDDERDITALGSGASFEIEVRGCGDKFQLTAGPGAGAPAIAAKIGGKEVAWDETSRTRFYDAMQIVFATTAFDAQNRVARLYQKGGAAEVLAAAAKVNSDYGQRVYLQALLGKDELTPEDTVRVWQIAGNSLGSDYELAQLVQEAPARHPSDKTVRQAMVRALRSIGSDYELRRTLDFLLEQGADAPLLEELLAVAGDKISSDYEQAELLLKVADKLPAGAALPDSLDRTLATISSDYELRRTLGAFTERKGLSRADLGRLLEVAATGISSDYELAELLVGVAQHQKSAEPWPPSLERALDTISSDHEEGRARKAFE